MGKDSADQDGPAKICFGIALTTDPAGSRRRLDDFCAALGAATGVTVTAQGLWHYSRLLEALQTGDVDFAWLPPILALRAIAQRRVIPIALPVRNGTASYSTALFTREDSKFRGVADLVGARAAWVDRQSAAGFQIIRASLRARGVDLERAFAADQFLGAHDAVARAVQDGEADVGATFVYFDETGADGALSIRRAGFGDLPMRILAHEGPIPSDLVAASIRVPVAITRQVQRALVGSTHAALTKAKRALFGAEGFIEARPEHLDPLTHLLERIEDPSAPKQPSLHPTRKS